MHVSLTRDIIVVGGSAGGIPTLKTVLMGLPAELDASIFVVLHLSPDVEFVIDRVLSYYTDVPVTMAHDREPIQPRHIYVAERDHHLIVERDRVRSIRGPKENWFRPSVDVLFRSAAYAFGPRTIGVVLSGMLDDGAAGLHAIKRRGGLAVVQDPDDARFPMMPEAALRAVAVDARLAAADIGRFLMKEIKKTAPPADRFPISKELELEVRISSQQLDAADLMAAAESIGERTPLTCPECHGALWQIEEEGQERFRCHVGHAYSTQALAAGQSKIIEEALWSAMRALEEKVTLTRRLSARLRSRGMTRGADMHAENAARMNAQAQLLRELVLKSRPQLPELEEQQTVDSE